MTVNLNDVLRVTAKMSQAGSDIQNVYHWKAKGTGSDTDLNVMNAIALRLDISYTTIDGLLTTGLTYDQIDFFNMTQDVVMGTLDWPVLVAGSLVAEALPLQTSALLLFGTLIPKSQGRKFLPPMAEIASGNAGDLDAATTTACINFIAAILSTVIVGTLQFDAGNYDHLLVRFAQWFSGKVGTYMRTQRRRVVGVGS